MPRLLLVSNSTSHGSGYLDHFAGQLHGFLAGAARVLFVPFALYDRDGYAAKARERLARLGFEVDSLHAAADPRRAVAEAEAIFIGGGNTFRLLRELYAGDLLAPIRERVDAGAPYVGTSAGTNVACPTVRTTNDMPIVEPPSLAALGLVPFQINPHFLDTDPSSTHHGETREQRIAEYLEENPGPVVALRESALLRVEGGEVELLGPTGGVLFARGEDPEPLAPEERLDYLLGG